MVKAAALYIVIIVSLLIAVISASLLTIAFYYRLEVQKKVRFDRLSANIDSGTAISLSNGFELAEDKVQLLDLFADAQDSIVLMGMNWGVYQSYAITAFEGRDTLKRSFFSGNVYIDPNALYLADEDRPLSLSGTTQITGEGQIPKSGLKQAYVDGKPYAGKELIKGKTSDSDRDIPPLDETLLGNIQSYLQAGEAKLKRQTFLLRDSLINSFFNPAQVYQLSLEQQDLANVTIRGKVILVSDTVLYIAATAVLEDVQIYAPGIVVEDGFKGSCQLFARDSISIGKDCEFTFPSFAGVFKPEDGKLQSKVSLGEGVKFEGVLLSYEKNRSDLQTMVALDKGCRIKGEVYATGYIKLERSAQVNGKVTTKRFIMQTPATLYENYLIDIVLNRKLLSPYYLSPFIFKRTAVDKKILKWLN